MSIPLLNQPDPNAPIDAERLAAEFEAGLENYMDVPLSQTHLACLALAAQRTMYQSNCSGPVREVLLNFLSWCSRHGDFGLETRKLMAAQLKKFREESTTDANGVQTPGRPESGQPNEG